MESCAFYNTDTDNITRTISLISLILSCRICSSWNIQQKPLEWWKSSRLKVNFARAGTNVDIPWLAILSLTQFNHPGSLNAKKPLVFGGRESEIEKFPWIAQLIQNGKPHCGGVVASSRVVLTAAHCIVDHDDNLINVKQFDVLVGSSYELKGVKYKPCEILKHPKFREKNIPFYYFDIALLLLTKKIKFSELVQPASIVMNNYWKNSRYSFVVAGFGVTTNEDDGTEKVRRTRMRWVNRKTCASSPSAFGLGKMPVPEHMFCMVGDKNTSDCRGDSGSGVMWSDYVVGLVSTARIEDCGSKAVPYMYVDLTYFRTWIRDSITRLELLTTGKCEKRT